MTMAPGWYDAGTPGRVRWWDGSHWTGMRIKGGVPGIDWSTTEQPALAWVFGSFFLVLGLAQFGLGVLTADVSAGGVTTSCLAVLWFAIALQTTVVRRIPAPRSAAVVIDAVRPLPGEHEGADAGWFSVAPNVTRWWTGARWSQYIATRYGPRPTFTGARSLRILVWMGRGLVGLGVLGLVAGVAVLVAGMNADDFGLMAVIGVVVIVGGILFGALGAVVLVMSRLQSRTLLLPQYAPQRNADAPR